jgi:small subunit ribosomal protein S16
LGTYNPLTNPVALNLNADRVRLWLSRGASPSDTVKHILARQGLLRAQIRPDQLDTPDVV